MNRARAIKTLLLPLLAGLAATMLVYLLTARQGKVQPPGAMAQVVVAAKAVPARTVIGPDQVALRSMPEQYLVAGALRRKEEVVGKTTTVPLAEGEMILEGKLALNRPGTAMAYRIPAGTRAMTVTANEVIAVAGFIQPGDQVDVLATFPKQLAGVDKTVLILEELPVLAVAHQAEQEGEKLKDLKSLTSVTLAVTPQQGARLALAAERGSIRLLLRPAVREGRVGEVEVNFDVFGRPGK